MYKKIPFLTLQFEIMDLHYLKAKRFRATHMHSNLEAIARHVYSTVKLSLAANDFNMQSIS